MDYSKPIEIAENIYRAETNEKDTFFKTNSCLTKGENESILTDPGSILQSEKIKEKMPSIDKSLVKKIIYVCDL